LEKITKIKLASKKFFQKKYLMILFFGTLVKIRTDYKLFNHKSDTEITKRIYGAAKRALIAWLGCSLAK